MIIYEQLMVDGFRSLGLISVNLANQGIIGLEGINKSTRGSNGSGKTSVLEAIVWCIFGRTFCKMKSVDDVCNRHLGGRCFVSLRVSKDGATYQMSRYRNHPKWGTGVHVHKDGQKLTLDKEIDARATLGLPILNLFMSVFAASTVFSASTPRFGSGMSDADRKTVLLATMGLGVDYSGKAKSALDDVRLHITMCEKMLAAKVSEVERLASALDAARNLEVRRQEEFEARERELQEQIVQHQDLARSLNDCEERVGRHQSAYDTAVTEHETLQNGIDIDVRILTTALHEDRTLIRQLEGRITEIHDLRASGKCPTCGQGLCDHDVASKEEELIAQKSGIDVRVRDHEAKLDTLRMKRADLNGSWDETQRYLLSDLQLAKGETARARASLGRIKILKAELHGLHNGHKQTVDLGVMEEHLESAREERNAQGDRIQALRTHEMYLRYWKNGFGKDGLPVDALRLMLPSMNERLRQYVRILTHNRLAAEVRLHKSKVIVHAAGATAGASYDTLSEGERRRIDLAIHFACHDAAILRTGGSNFMFIDEAVDVVDGVGVDAYLQALQLKMQSTSIDTIIVVSHRQELMSLLQRRFIVTKQEGVSTASFQSGDVPLEVMAG